MRMVPSRDVANNAGTTGKRLGGITGKGFLPGRNGNPSGRPKRLPRLGGIIGGSYVARWIGNGLS